MQDRFHDARTYSKSSTTASGAPKPTGPRAPPPPPEARRMNQIDNETENFQIPQSGLDLANRIKTIRCQKEMTQKDLAVRANLKVDIIRDYENGKAIPDNKIIKRLETALGEPLRPKAQKSGKGK